MLVAAITHCIILNSIISIIFALPKCLLICSC
nr:MAG TPA: hypothetical protein [Caudoviricetes sp.]